VFPARAVAREKSKQHKNVLEPVPGSRQSLVLAWNSDKSSRRILLMTVNQTFRGVGCLRVRGRWALVGSWVALSFACSGSIEQTDVDIARAERASGRTPAPAAPAAQTPARNPAPAPAPTPTATTPSPSATPAAAPAARSPATSPAGSDEVSFAADVWPIFSGKCGPCHTVANLGQQNIGNADKQLALADAKRIEDKLVMDLSGGRMPPTGCGGPPGSAPGCVSEADFELIQDWIMADTPP
jgi:mono/diheme cytochrome c family protein